MKTTWSWWRRRVMPGAAVALSALVLATGCEFGVTDAGGEPTPPPEQRDEDGVETGDTDEDDPSALILIMDASGSMNAQGPDGQTLLDSAKQALHDLVAALPDEQHVGLRVYGHRYPNTDRTNGCQDTELIHPVSPLDRAALTEAIDGFDAVGFTPIGLSLQEAANDLPPEGPRTIVLVSDGEDTCAPPEPCDVAADLAAAGVELIINTVGFALDGNDQARQELECIAEAGGGVFQDTSNAAELADALQESARDRREAELAGGELPGAPLPRDANTGAPDTPYQDTVLGVETNFYRFEIPPGSEVRAEVITSYDNRIGDCRAIDTEIRLVDASDTAHQPRSHGTSFHSTQAGQTETYHTDPVQVPEGEVWLRLATSRSQQHSVGAADCGEAQLEVEFQLTIR